MKKPDYTFKAGLDGIKLQPGIELHMFYPGSGHQFLKDNRQRLRVVGENREGLISPNWFMNKDLTPFYMMKFRYETQEGQQEAKYYLSKPKITSQGRIVFAYLYDSGDPKKPLNVKTTYKSNSNSVWRTISDLGMGIYGKGVQGEDSVTLPIKTQSTLEGLAKNPSRFDNGEEEFLFLKQVCRNFIEGKTFVGDEDMPIAIGEWDDEGRYNFFKDRSNVDWKEIADIFKNKRTYPTMVEALGRPVDSYIATSEDGELTYLLFHDKSSGASWIGSLQPTKIKLNGYGVNANRLDQASTTRYYDFKKGSPESERLLDGHSGRIKLDLLCAAFDYSSNIPPMCIGSPVKKGYYEATSFTSLLLPVRTLKAAIKFAGSEAEKENTLPPKTYRPRPIPRKEDYSPKKVSQLRQAAQIMEDSNRPKENIIPRSYTTKKKRSIAATLAIALAAGGACGFIAERVYDNQTQVDEKVKGLQSQLISLGSQEEEARKLREDILKKLKSGNNPEVSIKALKDIQSQQAELLKKRVSLEQRINKAESESIF